ncbi:MAG: hypothetical protein EPN82_16805 [Bacteroidetes bacterium]|nr:MAG: hypothetical protein EPN82_16805 [Bacteroidota bacterium]
MKNEIINKENLKRRKFLGVLGIGTAGLAAGKLISSFKKDKMESTKLDVSVHPNAVPRNKRGKLQ